MLYYGTQNVWESRDGGDHWEKISPDLTAHPGKPPLPNPEGVHHGDALVALSPSTVQAGVIWTGSNNGVLYLTEDGGKQWLDVTPPDMSMYGVINVQASRFNPSEAYAAVRNDAIADYSPHIYRTRDFGKSWEEIVTGLPYRSADRQLCADVAGSRSHNQQFAVRSHGVVRSTCRSTMAITGNRYCLNLPERPHAGSEIHDGDQIAATYGREYGFWTIHHRSKRMTVELKDRQGSRFRPRRDRVQSNINQDTPFPPEVPHGKNPPQASCDRLTTQTVEETVQPQILDAKGNGKVFLFESHRDQISP